MDYIFDDLGGPSVLSTGPKFLYVQILWIFILQILRYFFLHQRLVYLLLHFL